MNLFPPLIFSASILAVAEEYCNGLGTSWFVGELLLLKFNFLSSWTKGITILETLVGWDIKPQRCVHFIMHSMGIFFKQRQPQVRKLKKPSHLLLLLEIHLQEAKQKLELMCLLPTYLVSSKKGLELISYPFQTKCFPLILTPEKFHYLGINAAWRSMDPTEKENKKEQKHLLTFLKLN